MTQFGRYRVLSPLGQGAMASVYLAEDPSLNRLVAVKVIHSHLASIGNLLSRFTAEAKTAASLRNPNIVEIFDYGLENGQQYLVMEYIDGPNLQFVLNLLDGKPMEADVCGAVICQAAEGLISAEENSVVHRDIKPENMMFTSEGSLKIADFGIAHINEQNLTQTGSILGSPSFMSPEQIDGGKPSHQTDMFSLGAVFYYCLTGRKPFSGNNIPTLMRSICDLPHKPVLDLQPAADPALVALVDTLLQKKPEDRGKGARWLALQLRAYLNQKGILDLAEKTRSFLGQVTVQAGDRTMVEAPRADNAVSRASAKAATPLKPGAKRVVSSAPSQPARRIPFSWPKLALPKSWPMSPLTLAIAGVSLLALITTGIWVGLWVSKTPAETPAALVEKKTKALPPTLQGISLDPPQIELAPGQNRFVRVTAVPPEALGTVTWNSQDSSVASVTLGEIRALKPGRTRIEARSASDGKMAVCEVTVTGPTIPPVVSAPKKLMEGATAHIFVTSAPPFAEVFLDSKYLGTTPLKKGGFSPGRRRLQVSHRNFRAIDTMVTLRAGENRMKFRLFEQ